MTVPEPAQEGDCEGHEQEHLGEPEARQHEQADRDDGRERRELARVAPQSGAERQ